MSEIHTIPVPPGWSAEQAWEAISRGDDLTAASTVCPFRGRAQDPTWTNVEVEDGLLVRWLAENDWQLR